MTPWKPLPLLVPMTSTVSPGAKIEQAISEPAAGAEAPFATVTSRRMRVGGTLALA